MVRETHGNTARVAPWGGRWMQLAIGIVCMSMIANLQYGWTLFVEPIDDKHGWGRTAIQVAFTIFIVTETWLVPVEGWFVDRFGPRIVVLVGGALCALSWALNAVADSLALLYLAAVIGGIGAGGVYGTCVGNALKWFPDRRGLAAGLTAAGFGAGSALTVVPIATMIETSGFEQTFLVFGLGQGLVILVLAWFLADPPKPGHGRAAVAVAERRHFAPQEMLRTPVFWVMYAMFTMVAAGGLMVTAQLGPIAADMGLVDAPVSLLGLTLPALTFALSIDRVMNGITRPFFGWVSDHIGRENTMFIAFTIEAVGVMALSAYGADPVAFVILTGLVFFAWGEIFSLFPACCADTFGSRFAATNAGMLYTAKGTAALLVPLGNLMVAATGSWQTVFYSVAIVNALAAFLALFILKPMRARYIAASTAAPRLTTRLAD
ncbi:spermidine/putrescine ABC transporter substrate-binding protein [Azospirillum thiophilum]|uniref:Spermidine/putrescine ABC transporter substrate-binding protein n=1 Tax=Azospirillum thiophilum TaxID=528244 RepID=A0AAC8ZV76_9PROT|nr:oxalate/formate MFS antiporter [Azospirillum thiophilum]ALG73477.1 spermidine/putrescine ABC transporter substrate-binding protein [Azospirillum thiophilum]KJR62868.1 spermidine/putrescine ABC transporter substrate-binding protein [Azospirillum thiophilum]